MSIPAIAIKRPVTMFMISSVIILLGMISLTRLPVDLLPGFRRVPLRPAGKLDRRVRRRVPLNLDRAIDH